MKRVIHFGKIDYYNRGRRENTAKIIIEYRTIKEEKKELSIYGEIWNMTNTDILSGGQNLDDMHKYLKLNKKFMTIYRLWKLYHLNGMHPECEHQHANGWTEQAKKEVTIYEYTTTMEAYQQKRKLKNIIIESAKQGKIHQTTKQEQTILNLKNFFKTHLKFEELTEEQQQFYKPCKQENKTLGWLTQEQHPEGILSKPCEICGYKYGSAWNYFPIPEEDEKIIMSILEA